MKMYLTWDHSEYGPENLRITDDKSNIMEMVENSGYLDDDFLKDSEESRSDVVSRIDKILADDNIGLHSLFNGWGGLHIQITEIFVPSSYEFKELTNERR